MAIVSPSTFSQAEEFDGSSNPVVAFKGIKIGDYNGTDDSAVRVASNEFLLHRPKSVVHE